MIFLLNKIEEVLLVLIEEAQDLPEEAEVVGAMESWYANCVKNRGMLLENAGTGLSKVLLPKIKILLIFSRREYNKLINLQLTLHRPGPNLSLLHLLWLHNWV